LKELSLIGGYNTQQFQWDFQYFARGSLPRKFRIIICQVSFPDACDIEQSHVSLKLKEILSISLTVTKLCTSDTINQSYREFIERVTTF